MLRSVSSYWKTNRKSDKWRQQSLRAACRRTSCRHRRLMTGRELGKIWHWKPARHHMGHQCMHGLTFACWCAQTRLGKRWIKAEWEGENGLGHSSARRKKSDLFSQKGGTSFPSEDGSELSRSPLKGPICESKNFCPCLSLRDSEGN